MKRILIACVLGACLAAGIPQAAFAQAKGAISGVVRDATGGVLPGAAVVVVNTATHARVDVFADKEGKYSVTSLAAGHYEVSASLPGFTPVRASVDLVAGQTIAQNLVLAMATLSENVTVTAQKKEERIMDVPMAITALSGGEKLEPLGARTMLDYAALVPGLQTTSGSNAATVQTLRGVSTGASALSGTVGTYRDDTPLGSSSAYLGGSAYGSGDPDVFDIERIEVLKGPQGTLYGAQSLGGLLKFVTAKPDLKKLSGSVEFGGDDVISHGLGDSIHAVVNAPVVPNVFAIRASGFRIQTPGYIDNVTTGDRNINTSDSMGGRVSALWKPNDAFALRFTSDYQKWHIDNSSTEDVNVLTLQPTSGDLKIANWMNFGSGDMKNAVQNLTLDYDFSWAHLVSSTSYQTEDVSTLSDATRVYGVEFGYQLGATGATISDTVNLAKWTEEIRLASSGAGPVEWIAGLFYTHESGGHPLESVDLYKVTGSTGTLAYPDVFTLTTSSTLRETAGFGDITYRFNPRFDVQAGLRYSQIAQDYSQSNYTFFGQPAMADLANSSSQTKLTYLATARYHTTESMGYVRVATGYRPGGPNSVFPGSTNPATYNSDSLINYEVGWKGTVPSASFDYAVDFFRINWKDIQVEGVDPVTQFGFYGNGGKAHSQGVEFGVGYSPAGLRFGASGAFMDAALDEDMTIPGALGSKGDVLPMAPKTSFTGTVDYEHALKPGVKGFAGLTVKEAGARRACFSGQLAGIPSTGIVSPVGEMPSYTALDLRGGVSWKQLTLTVFVKNVTDTRAALSLGYFGAGLDLSTFTVGPGDLMVMQPRTIGLTARVSF